MRKYLGISIIFAMVLAGLAIWYAGVQNDILWSEPGMFMRTLGRIAGISGLILFSINFILAARFKILEPIFGGLAGMYVDHHRLGATAFILLLFHPVFLATRFLLVSAGAAWNFLAPAWNNLPVLIGTIGLLTMIGALALTFYGRLAYEHWKISHKTLGAAFILGSLHAFLVPSDISFFAPLWWFMLILISAGILSFFYYSIFGRWLVKKVSYSVKSITSKSAGIWEIVLSPKQAGLNFAPGQFAFISFPNSSLPTEPHPFSVISPAGSFDLTFGIKESGDYTRSIGRLSVGAKALVEGPYGRFALEGDYKNKDLIWIAGGIGVTPFVSMANSLPEYTNKKIDLYYSVVKPEEAVFGPELMAAAQNNPNLNVISYNTAEKGFLTAQQINQTSQNLFKREIYLCGPVGMMRSLRQQLVAVGVSNGRIHSEEFSLG